MHTLPKAKRRAVSRIIPRPRNPVRQLLHLRPRLEGRQELHHLQRRRPRPRKTHPWTPRRRMGRADHGSPQSWYFGSVRTSVRCFEFTDASIAREGFFLGEPATQQNRRPELNFNVPYFRRVCERQSSDATQPRLLRKRKDQAHTRSRASSIQRRRVPPIENTTAECSNSGGPDLLVHGSSAGVY